MSVVPAILFGRLRGPAGEPRAVPILPAARRGALRRERRLAVKRLRFQPQQPCQQTNCLALTV